MTKFWIAKFKRIDREFYRVTSPTSVLEFPIEQIMDLQTALTKVYSEDLNDYEVE